MDLDKSVKQCVFYGCGQFQSALLCCNLCTGKFCKDHHPPFTHNCLCIQNTLLAENQVSDNSALLHVRLYSCSSDGCQESSHMKLECSMCGKNYCINHRRHGCIDPVKEKLLAKRDKSEAKKRQFEAAKQVVDCMVEATIEKHRNRHSSKLATVNKIQLMRLKQRASGQPDIPPPDRAHFFFHWKAVDSDKIYKKALYVSKDWAVSYVIEMVAKECDSLMNGRCSDFHSLRLFHMDGRLLTKDLSLILQRLLSENILFDGSNLLIDTV